jgi:hypothetical protein
VEVLGDPAEDSVQAGEEVGGLTDSKAIVPRERHRFVVAERLKSLGAFNPILK